MIDPRRFKAPFIPKERIWQHADELRGAHPSGRSLPVKVLDLAEFDLGLDLIPASGLREEVDIDALLMGDLTSILVDRHAFMAPRLEYRLRFSVAHEIGHLILHGDTYRGLQHASAKEWFDYISAIPDVEYGWVEWQAHEFAGRLLVPPVGGSAPTIQICTAHSNPTLSLKRYAAEIRRCPGVKGSSGWSLDQRSSIQPRLFHVRVRREGDVTGSRLKVQGSFFKSKERRGSSPQRHRGQGEGNVDHLDLRRRQLA